MVVAPHIQVVARSRVADRMPVAVRNHLAVALRSRTAGRRDAAHRTPAVGRPPAEARSRVAGRTGRDLAARRAVRPVVVHLVSDPVEVVASPSGDCPPAARLSSGLLGRARRVGPCRQTSGRSPRSTSPYEGFARRFLWNYSARSTAAPTTANRPKSGASAGRSRSASCRPAPPPLRAPLSSPEPYRRIRTLSRRHAPSSCPPAR